MKRTKSLRSILLSRCCILHADYRLNMGMPKKSTLKPHVAWEPRYKLHVVITSQLVCVFMPIDLHDKMKAFSLYSSWFIAKNAEFWYTTNPSLECIYKRNVSSYCAKFTQKIQKNDLSACILSYIGLSQLGNMFEANLSHWTMNDCNK